MKKFAFVAVSVLLPLLLITPASAMGAPAPLQPEALSTEVAPFETRIIEDSGLPAGVEVVEQKGVDGVVTHFRTTEPVKTADGTMKKVPRLYDELTKHPVEQVVRKGMNSTVISGVSDKTKELEAAKAAEAAAAAEAAEAEAKAAKKRSGGAALPSLSAEASAGMTSPEENRAYAQSIMSAEDFACFNSIAMRESGWRTDATNSSSGAYGVPQSLPASKLASAGADWQTNGKTQVNWMVGYINGRYGSACAAVAFWDANHWY